MEPASPGFSISSALMYVMLAVMVGSLVVSIVQSIREAKGRNTSRFLWVAGPLALLSIGLAAVGRAMSSTTGQIRQLPPEERQKFLAEGASLVMNLWTFTGLCLLLAGIAGVVGLGVSQWWQTREKPPENSAAGRRLVVSSLIGAILIGALATAFWEIPPIDYVGALSLGLAGSMYGVSIWFLRHGPEAPTPRKTNAVSATLMVSTVLGAAVTAVGLLAIGIFKGLEGVKPAARGSFVSGELSEHWFLFITSGGPILWSLGLAVLGFLGTRGDSETGDAGPSPFKLAAAMLPVLLAAAYAAWNYPEFRALVTTQFPN